MDQLDYTYDEIMADHPFAEPLVVQDLHCHGGYDEDGNYIPPRMLNRERAIKAWHEKLQSETNRPLLDCPDDMFADFYPNVAQTKYLLSEGIRQPLIDILTQIGTVEGFGAIIGQVQIPDLQKLFVEDVRGTATAHLGKGLFEAHARDEAGFEDISGHRDMWYAVRDIAFEYPECGDPMQMMMKQMQGGGGKGGEAMAGMASAVMPQNRIVPEISKQAEIMISRMTGLLLIERLAFQTFSWAKEVLGSSEDLAHPEDTTRIVDFICADEYPHVDYTQVALTEMQSRTFIGEDGQRIPGIDVIEPIWKNSMKGMFGFSGKRSTRRDMIISLLNQDLEGNRRKDEILRNFHDLETPDVMPEVHQEANLAAADRGMTY